MSSSVAEPLLPAGRFAPHRREQPGAILGTNFANSACAIACRSMVHRWLIEPISGIEMGEQADKMKDILGPRLRISFMCGMEPLSNQTVAVPAMGATSSERGTPVSYGYSFEDLLALLHGHAPAKVDAIALNRRRVEHGYLSVGLKIHCLGDASQFSTLVEGLGGTKKILDVNYYKHSHASLCLVLPPVGSAHSAILLLECIEHFIGSPVFSNPEIQIQVCSPGRLDPHRSALLAIGFYLGSDTLRRYTSSPIVTADWTAAPGQQWTVPVGGGLGRVFKVGDQPIDASVQGFYNVV